MDLAHEPPFRLGSLDVRPAERQLRHAGGSETLEPRVMEVLVLFAKAGGEVVSKDDLIAACWQGRAVSDDAINRVISRLRRLSELTGGRDFTIETITKVGYRLRAGEPTADPAAAPPQIAASWRRPPRGAWIALALGLVIVAIGAIAAQAFWPKASDAEPMTLAVLPFDNVGAGDAGEVFADALPRDIRARVSRVRGLRVIGDASSVLAASEAGSGPDRIGWKLGADLVLDGSVRMDGETMRAMVELVDAGDGAIVWTRTYDGPAADMAAAEAALSSALLEYLVQRLGPNRIEALTPPRSVDTENHRLIAEARLLMREIMAQAQNANQPRANEAVARADTLLRQVLARDPENPDALVLLAMIAGREGARTEDGVVLANENQRRAYVTRLWRRALRSDPDNPAALTALAEQYRRFDWRWEESERLLRRAIAIDPNFSDAQIWLTYLLTTTGRCVEALEHAQIAAGLDPAFTWRRLGVPRALSCAGRWAEADAYYDHELSRDPGNVFLAREIYMNAIMRGDSARVRALARRLSDELWAGAPTPPVARVVARMEAGADALDGRPAALVKAVDEDLDALVRLRTPEYRGRLDGDLYWTFAVELAAAGEADRAADLLARSVNARTLYIPQNMPYGEFEFTEAVRATPRYQALWRGDPQLTDLLHRRRQALRDRQMAGYDERGRHIAARRVSVPPPAS